MPILKVMLANSWTTTIGVLVAVANFLATVGDKMPSTPSEWWSLVISLLYVALGVVAKDATTGSKPKDDSTT
jgi:hypothetical protein